MQIFRSEGLDAIHTFLHFVQRIQKESSGDLFHKLARQVSTCPYTREDGGQIGWIDNPRYKSQQQHDAATTMTQTSALLNRAILDIVSAAVIDELFQRRVKGGDVIKLPITVDTDDDNDTTTTTTEESKPIIRGWHVLRVDDLHLRPVTTASDTSTHDNSSSSSKNIVHKVRPKLKGSGVVPLSPAFISNDNLKDDEGDDDAAATTAMYTVPNAKYYKIVTTGCQMNVADSERITGVLEDELKLSPLGDVDALSFDSVDSNANSNKNNDNRSKKKKKKKNTPDVLLLNTCTIRDHAEQKVYDALGPYAAMKRDGKAIAIVVAGCVAQQEGEYINIVLESI